MTTPERPETFVEQHVTYILEVDGQVIMIEHVPARVCVDTGEQLFAPDTALRLQQTLWGEKTPVRVLQTPVFDFAA